MNNPSFQRAFTIVELLIVIVVIGILAATTLVAFPGIQNNAKDAKIKEGAVKIANVTEEWAIRADAKSDDIKWGSGTTGAATIDGDGIANCTNGDSTAATYSWVASGKNACNLEDVLVQSNYLNSEYIEALPQNSFTNQPGETYRIVKCFNQPKNFVLLYSLYIATTEDDDEYDSTITMCGINNSEQTVHGMRGAKLIRVEG